MVKLLQERDYVVIKTLRREVFLFFLESDEFDDECRGATEDRIDNRSTSGWY